MIHLHFTEKDYLMMSMMFMKKGSKKGFVSFYTFGEILDNFGPLEKIVENLRHIVSQPWFFGHQSVHSVSIRLAGEEQGTYLLR